MRSSTVRITRLTRHFNLSLHSLFQSYIAPHPIPSAMELTSCTNTQMPIFSRTLEPVILLGRLQRRRLVMKTALPKSSENCATPVKVQTSTRSLLASQNIAVSSSASQTKPSPSNPPQRRSSKRKKVRGKAQKRAEWMKNRQKTFELRKPLLNAWDKVSSRENCAIFASDSCWSSIVVSLTTHDTIIRSPHC